MGNKLTVKEQKFVTEYVQNGGNGTEAALEAYDTVSEGDAASIASHNLKKPAITDALQAEMERQGITLEAVISPIRKGLSAVGKDGQDDLSTQLSAHDRAVKILTMAEKKASAPPISFNINKANFGGEFVQNEED